MERARMHGRIAETPAISPTTASIYGYYDLSDLERAMEALAQVRRSEEEEEPAD